MSDSEIRSSLAIPLSEYGNSEINSETSNENFNLSLGELNSLRQERDPNLRAEGLLSLADRQARLSGPEIAVPLYLALLEASETPAAIRGRAQARLEALRGEGAVGARVEVLLSHFAQEITDPSALLAMTAAGAAFRATRFLTLTGLSSNPSASLFTRALGARTITGLVGFAAEATVFPLAGRLGNLALGREQEWNREALGRDLASSFLMLGALRAGGLVSGSLASGSLLRPWIQQGGIFGGILLGHELEVRVGLRERQSGAITLVDSFATLLQFHAAGRWNQSLMGEGMRGWERSMEMRSEALSLPRLELPESPRLPTWIPALAGASQARPLPHVPEVFQPDRVYMASQGGEGSPPHPGGRETYRESRTREARLTEIRERFRDPQADIRDRSRAIREFSDELRGNAEDSHSLQEGILQLFDLAITPPVQQAQEQYASTPEDEGRILRTLALEAVRDLFPEKPDPLFRRHCSLKLDQFSRSAHPHLLREYIAAPPHWPSSDPRYVGPEISRAEEKHVLGEFSPTGVLDINLPLFELYCTLRERASGWPHTLKNNAARENPVQFWNDLRSNPSFQVLEIWQHHLTQYPWLHRLFQAFSGGTALAGLSLFTEIGEPSHLLDGSLGGALAVFGIAMANAPALINRFVVQPNRNRRARWTEYQSEHFTVLQTQMERSLVHPFAALAPKREDYVGILPQTRVEISPDPAEVETEAEWEAELDRAIKRTERNTED